MLERLRQNLTGMSYGSLALEMVVVIFGILIAFQIDRWAEDRRDRETEHAYLVRLKDDLQGEIQNMDVAIRQAKSRLAAILLLEDALKNPAVAQEKPDAVVTAVDKVTWRSFPQINAFIYSELQNTGNLSLIQSESLRRELADHYSSIRHHERVGLDLNIQHHMFNKKVMELTRSRAQNIIETIDSLIE